MAYFPNGTSARAYQERYCENCLHDVNKDCAVWLAHLVTEYCDKDGNTSEAGKVLDMLISDDGHIGYKQCRMFVELSEPPELFPGTLEQLRDLGIRGDRATEGKE